MKIGLIDVDKQSRTMRNEVYNCDCIEYMRTLPDLSKLRQGGRNNLRPYDG